MDILNSEQVWIEDRCYRLLPIRDSSRGTEDDDEPSSAYILDGSDYDPDLPIMHQGNRFYITIHVPATLHGYVCGKQGKMVKAIEQQYGAKVNVPQKKHADAGITIYGSTKKIVSDTYHRIEDIVNFSRFKTESNYFISLPVNSSEIQQSFLKFKEEILAKYKGVRGVDASIFQKPSKLHVTVTVLVLLDERDKQNAIAILTKCRDNIIKHLGIKEFVVQVKGIEYMNDDPAEVDVLYAKLKELDDDNCLQIVADNIMKEFVKARLSKDQHDKVKLHITLMNTLFREKLECRDDNSECRDDNLERLTFDARPILTDYIDYDFGQLVVSEVHISVRYSTAPSDGYYSSIHKMKLNT